MSKRFLTKLAGGVALGSAALLLSAPAAALAAPDGSYEESKATERNGVVCVTNEQLNVLIAANIINDNTIRDNGDVTFEQNVTADATNENNPNQPNATIVCFRDVDVDVEVEED